MPTKQDYKKAFKAFYNPKTEPSIIDVPEMNFVMIDGEGDPNGDTFGLVVESLYAFSYAVKMSYKSTAIPDGYYDYTVFPLEGVWDLVDKTKGITNKSNFKYTLMIRQPDFLTSDLFERFIQETKKKKPNLPIERLYFKALKEGLSCQMMHIGSYDTETASFEIMENYCNTNTYKRHNKIHREIYLSDPRKTEASKLKTILRFAVEKQ